MIVGFDLFLFDIHILGVRCSVFCSSCRQILCGMSVYSRLSKWFWFGGGSGSAAFVPVFSCTFLRQLWNACDLSLVVLIIS